MSIGCTVIFSQKRGGLRGLIAAARFTTRATFVSQKYGEESSSPYFSTDSFHELFGTQRDHRINLCRPPCRQVRSEQADG
jgi:hypothetical protein